MKATQPPRGTSAAITRTLYDSTLGFVLYAFAMIGCLGTITALIEKAAP